MDLKFMYWQNVYDGHLRQMYQIFLNCVKDIKNYKKQVNFPTFCRIVYNQSSKQIYIHDHVI